MKKHPKVYLVTGAGGYIGSHVIKELLNHGHTVLAVDRNFENVDKRAIKVNIQIFDNKNVWGGLPIKPDVLIHLAIRDGFNHNSSAHFEDLPKNYFFFKTMLEAGLKQLVVMSTMHEIGYFEGMVTENTPTNPANLYGIAKNALRQCLNTIKTDATIQWLRGFYITGDDRLNHSVFAKILESEAKGELTFPLNSGKNQYDFLDINDLARQIVAVSEQTKITGIINCCSGKPMSLKERVENFITKNKLKIKPKYNVFPDRPYDSPIIYGDVSKINQILGKK